jgi:hypothetical protein
VCTLPGEALLPGVYQVDVGAHSKATGRSYDWVPSAIAFHVAPVSSRGEADADLHGIVNLGAAWSGEPIEGARRSGAAQP